MFHCHRGNEKPKRPEHSRDETPRFCPHRGSSSNACGEAMPEARMPNGADRLVPRGAPQPTGHRPVRSCGKQRWHGKGSKNMHDAPVLARYGSWFAGERLRGERR